MRNKFTAFAISLSALYVMPAGAASDNSETLYVVGLPSIESFSSNLPPEAIVIEREQLSQFGAASLADVLEHIPEISINQNGGRGSFNSLFLRGADPNFTQVRIDGIAINNATNTRGGAFDIGSINTQIIERIEIISDASSAIYGSQALAGVINIVTRSSGTEASVELDSEGGEVASIFIANDNSAFSVVSERPGSVIEGSRYQSDEIGFKTHWAWSDVHQLQLVARYQDYTSQAFADDSGGSLFAVSSDLENRQGTVAHLAAHYEFLTDSGDLFEFNSGFFNQKENRISPAIAPGLRDPFGLPEIIEQTDYERVSIDARYTKTLNSNIRWRSGVSWEQERGQQSGQLDFSFFQIPTDFDLTRTSVSATQSLEFNLSKQIKAIISARADDTESGSSISPRLSISYAFDDNAQLLYANLGEGFKQASIYALVDPLVGNPELLDETARSIQIGHRYQRGNWYAKHSLYYYDYQNLIDFEPGPPPSLVNRDSVRINGVESSIGYKQTSWSVDTFQSYNSNTIDGTSQVLRQRPSYRAGVQGSINVNENLSLWLKSLYVDERLDSSIPTGDLTLSSYHVSDLGFSWKISKQLKMNAQWKNVFSKRYSTSIGNIVDGDTVLLQLTYRGD